MDLNKYTEDEKKMWKKNGINVKKIHLYSNKCLLCNACNFKSEQPDWERDLNISEIVEQKIINNFNNILKRSDYNHLTFLKNIDCDENNNPIGPDLILKNNKSNKFIDFYFEVKLGQRSFGQINNINQNNDNYFNTYNTLCLNTSDMIVYINNYFKKGSRVIIIWELKNRPCICVGDNPNYFSLEITNDFVEKFYSDLTKQHGKFVRDLTDNDIDKTTGEIKGVISNYHINWEKDCINHGYKLENILYYYFPKL